MNELPPVANLSPEAQYAILTKMMEMRLTCLNFAVVSYSHRHDECEFGFDYDHIVKLAASFSRFVIEGTTATEIVAVTDDMRKELKELLGENPTG